MSRTQRTQNDAMPEGVMRGHYAQKQLGSRSRLIAWSHRRRLATARCLVTPHAGKRLLDYGCGDGTFLAQVSSMFPDAVGADVDEQQIEDCRQRLAQLHEIQFVTVNQLREASYAGSFDLICCMEVLEHCLDAEADNLLIDLDRLLAPQGSIIISVPIEIGPALFAKELFRALAGWRKLGDYQYRDSYRLSEMLRMIGAGSATAISRPVYPFGAGSAHSHKGFNWRSFHHRISRVFAVREVRFSPFSGFAGWFSSQVWFRCERWP